MVNPDAEYHLSFQTTQADKSHGAYQEMAEVQGDAYTNTVKEDNYKPSGLLDFDTKNPAVLCFAYLMTNDKFRAAVLHDAPHKAIRTRTAVHCTQELRR